MRVNSNQNSGVPASAPESETKIKDGLSNTMESIELSKAKNPFANDSFEASKGEAHGLKVDLMFDTLHQVQLPRDQASGQFMDYTDDSCVTSRGTASGQKAQADISSNELKSKAAGESAGIKYTLFLPEGE